MGVMRYTTSTEVGREEALEAAASAIQQGELVVIPTDTVYGLAADAFDQQSVQALLDAQGPRGATSSPRS